MFWTPSQRVFDSSQLDPRLRAGSVLHLVGDGCGNTWFDKSMYNNHGILTNFATTENQWTLGHNGLQSALTFDGSDDYINLGSTSPSLNITTGDLSLCAWIYMTSTATEGHVISQAKSDGNLVPWAMEVNRPSNGGAAGKLTFVQYSGNSPFTAFFASSTLVMNANQWYHVCITRPANSATGATWTVNIYINGQLDSSTSAVGDPGLVQQVTAIGRPGAQNAAYFIGKIEGPRIYNRVLSAAEIAMLASIVFSPIVPVRRRIAQKLASKRTRYQIQHGGQLTSNGIQTGGNL